MLSDEDSRFRESWKERGESRHKLCCLPTLWGQDNIVVRNFVLCNVFYVILCYLRYYVVYEELQQDNIVVRYFILHSTLFFFVFDHDVYSIFLYYSLDRILNFKNFNFKNM